MTQPNSSLAEWRAVAAHADELKDAHLRDLTAADPRRWQNFHVVHDSWLLDISRQRVTARTLPLLFDLARAADLPARIAAMFRGDPINTTEQRAVLHTALRSDFAGSAAIQAEVRDSRKKLVDFVAAVRSGRKLGITGKTIQACREYRHRRLGPGAAPGVRRAQGRVERRTSRRTSCRTSTARSSRI